MATEVSPEGVFSHYEIDVRRPHGWVELGADGERPARKFFEAGEVHAMLALLEEDGFKAITVWVDTAGKRTTCRLPTP